MYGFGGSARKLKLSAFTALFMASLITSCVNDDKPSLVSPRPNSAGIEFCPIDVEEEAKTFLGLNVNNKIEMKTAEKNIAERDYASTYQSYIVFNKKCWDSSLEGSRQLHVAVGLGKDKSGNDVFRAYILTPDDRGYLRRIEARYSYW